MAAVIEPCKERFGSNAACNLAACDYPLTLHAAVCDTGPISMQLSSPMNAETDM